MLALALALVFASGCEARPGPAADRDGPGLVAPRVSYADTVAEAERAVRRAETLVRAAPESGIRQGQLAARLLRLAKLTGDYAHFGRADEALRESFRLGGGRVGPYLVRAQQSFALHRFDRVEPDLRSAELLAARHGDAETMAEVLALRGQLAEQGGEYDRARELERESLAMGPSFEALAALADLAQKTRDESEGTVEELLDEAESLVPASDGQSRAWVALQRGDHALESGDRSAARAHYLEADSMFFGDWRAQERLAALAAVDGDAPRAIAMYERLVDAARDPDALDALATLLGPRDPERAASLVARAREIHERRGSLFPEAACGHALRHFLDHEHDPTRALELAQENFRLRPNGEAATLLARAFLAADRVADADAVIAAVLVGPYRSPELEATRAAVTERKRVAR